MKVKASLHLHSKEDYKDGDVISYFFFQLIDEAEKNDFKVLAFTGHEKMVCLPEHVEYGKKKGILVIPGVEALIEGKHILILNCNDSANNIKNFKQLEDYKKENNQIFIIAPHPNYGFLVSLGFKKLIRYRELFDAVEHSWFYSKRFNLNLKTIKVIKEIGLPLVATSDLHDIRHFNKDYLVAEVNELTIVDFFSAIKKNKFINYTEPKNFYELIFFQLFFSCKSFFIKLLNVFKYLFNLN